jgi:hypothetical protein
MEESSCRVVIMNRQQGSWAHQVSLLQPEPTLTESHAKEFKVNDAKVAQLQWVLHFAPKLPCICCFEPLQCRTKGTLS